MQYLDFERVIKEVDEKLTRLSNGERALLDKNQVEIKRLTSKRARVIKLAYEKLYSIGK